MNIVIVGRGAIGLLFYQALQYNADLNVSVLKYKNHFSQVCFSNINGYSTMLNITETSSLALQQANIILICVKAYQVQSALENIKATLSSNAIIILCHNGIIDISKLHTNDGSQHAILSMLTTHGCKKVTPKHIIHTGEGHCDIGLYRGSIAQHKITNIIELFSKALLNVYWQENILYKQWLKLAINCVINPLTAIYNIPNGDILKPKYQKEITQIINEFIAIAKSQQLDFNHDELQTTIKNVAQATALNTSSMRSDVMQGKQTEIDHINGYLIELGKENNIATPLNTQFYQEMQQKFTR